MTKKIILDAFYGQLFEFLDQLTLVFPDDSDFPTFKTALQLTRRTNPTLGIREMSGYLLAVEKKIRSRNADYFLETTAPDGLAPDTLIQKLRTYWKSMSPQNQEVVWSYLNLLMELAKRYTAL